MRDIGPKDARRRVRTRPPICRQTAPLKLDEDDFERTFRRTCAVCAAILVAFFALACIVRAI